MLVNTWYSNPEKAEARRLWVQVQGWVTDQDSGSFGLVFIKRKRLAKLRGLSFKLTVLFFFQYML